MEKAGTNIKRRGGQKSTGFLYNDLAAAKKLQIFPVEIKRTVGYNDCMRMKDENKKAAITKAIIGLINQIGFANISMSKIAKATGLSAATLYVYYETRRICITNINREGNTEMSSSQKTGYPSIDKPWMKYYNETVINAPLPKCTMYDYLRNNNLGYESRIAFNYFDNKITYRTLFENILQAAKAFVAVGIKQGDIVTICSVSTPETFYAFYALNYLGAVSNMIDPRTSVEGIREYILEAKSKIVLCIDKALQKIAEAVRGTAVKELVALSPADSLGQPKKLLITCLILRNIPPQCGVSIGTGLFVQEKVMLHKKLLITKIHAASLSILVVLQLAQGSHADE